MTESTIIPTRLRMDPIASDFVSPSSEVVSPLSPSQHFQYSQSQAPTSLYLSNDDQQRVVAAQIRRAKVRLQEAVVKGNKELCKKECTGLLAIDVPLHVKYDKLQVKDLLRDNSKLAESVDATLSALGAGITILEKYAKNLLKPLTQRPSVWRTVKFSNEIFRQRVANIKGSVEIIRTLGYTVELPDGLTYPEGIEPDHDIILRLTTELVMLQNELTAYRTGNHPHANVLEAHLLQLDTSDTGVKQADIQLQSIPVNPTGAPLPTDSKQTEVKDTAGDGDEAKSSSDDEFCSLPPDATDAPTSSEMCHVCGETSVAVKCENCEHETNSFCNNCDNVWHKNPKRQSHKRTPLYGDILEKSDYHQSETIRVIPGKSSAAVSTSNSPTLLSTDEQLKFLRQQQQQNWQKSKEKVSAPHNASDLADDVIKKPVHHPPGVTTQQSHGFASSSSVSTHSKPGDSRGDTVGPQSLLNYNSQTGRPHYTLISGSKPSITRRMTPERSPTPTGQMNVGPCPKCYAMINYSENRCSQCNAQISEDFKLKVKKEDLVPGMQHATPKHLGPQGDVLMLDPNAPNLTLPKQSLSPNPSLQYPMPNSPDYNQHLYPQQQSPNIPVSSNRQLLQQYRPPPPPSSTLPNLYPPQTIIPNTPGSDTMLPHTQQPVIYPPQTISSNHPDSTIVPSNSSRQIPDTSFEHVFSNADPHLQQSSVISKSESPKEVSQSHQRRSSSSGGKEGYTCEWQCEHCTFLNDPGTRVCSVCDKTSDKPILLNQEELQRTPLGDVLHHSQSTPSNLSGTMQHHSPPNLSDSNMLHQSPNLSATLPHQSSPNLSATTLPHHSPNMSATLPFQSSPNLSATTLPHHSPNMSATLPFQSSPNLSATTLPHHSPNMSATLPYQSPPNVSAATMPHKSTTDVSIGRRFIEDQDKVYLEKKEAHRQYQLKLKAERQMATNATAMKSNVNPPQQISGPQTLNVLPRIEQTALAQPTSEPQGGTQHISPPQPSLISNMKTPQQPLNSDVQPQQPSQSFVNMRSHIVEGDRVEQAIEAIHEVQPPENPSQTIGENTLGQGRSLMDIVGASPQQFLPQVGQSGKSDTIKKALEKIEAKKHQEDMIISGQKLIRLIRAADVSDFSLEEMEIAIEISEKEDPINWLHKFWDNMIETVITMATIQDGGEFGEVSYIEARMALGECRGRIQDTVDYCRASREKKVAELIKMTASSREDVLDSLLQNGGDVADSALSLHRQSLIQFQDHIWADVEEHAEAMIQGDIQVIMNSQEIMESLKNVNIDAERRTREILVEGRLKSWEEAESVMKILEIGDEEMNVTLEDIIEAVKTNSGDVYGTLDYLKQECEICYETFPMHYIRSMILCTCSICTSCMKQYMEQNIRESPAKNFVCPVCQVPDIENNPQADNHFQMLNLMLGQLVEEDVLDLFQRKLRDWNIQKEPNFRWCASCECGFIFNPQNPGQLKMVCPDCNKHTCFKCKKIWEPQHHGITCEEFAKWKADNDPEHQAAGLAKHLQENGIDCPRCNFRYALARGGCMHFTCNQCKHEFCSGCSKPFIRGDNCKELASCAKAGMHCHHPRDCLYYLRDYDVKTLQQLLMEKNVKYNTEPAAGAENTGKCGTMEQKDIADGLKDELCGREVPPKYAGLCSLHYKEYLVTLINNNSIDPIEKMNEEELLILLQRNGKQALKRKENEALPRYKERLIDHIKEVIPLPKRAQRNL
ncbi:unnamed protein product [Owenia fusiformis]|uniref:Uncharacterized protein n=1 Tax=Owenia fusiformis TaxID=6347 RepID=A0A8J1Y902_OWEFU|nr:unnamed protein product [Owenia fusiformis]